MKHSKAVQRILNQLGRDSLLDELLHELSTSDLNTLLLELFRRKAAAVSAPDLLKHYADNRFVQPSALDPLALKHMEMELLSAAQAHAYQPVQLSPVAPLGSCSVVGTVDQNKIISALRGTEVTADATNALALHICHGIRNHQLSHSEESIRFCTTHRHVRAQHFNQPGLWPHFHLFCMVTSGHDEGSYFFEKKALTEHLRFYQQQFSTLFHAKMQVRLNRVGGYTDGEGLIRRLSQHIQMNVPDLPVIENIVEGTNNYYKGLQFAIVVTMNGTELNIGDGGFVDWPQKLLGRKKERMLISAIGLERLVNLQTPSSPFAT